MGAQKKAENLGWAIKGLREMSKPRGKVYLRIGEPVSMSETLVRLDLAEDSAVRGMARGA